MEGFIGFIAILYVIIRVVAQQKNLGTQEKRQKGQSSAGSQSWMQQRSQSWTQQRSQNSVGSRKWTQSGSQSSANSQSWMQNTHKPTQQELKERLQQRYGSRQTAQQSYRNTSSQGYRKPSVQQNDILTRATANVMENQQDELQSTSDAAKRDAAMMADAQRLADAIDIESTSELMQDVNEMIVMGYQPKLSFERDFIAEGMEMLTQFEMPNTAQNF